MAEKEQAAAAPQNGEGDSENLDDPEKLKELIELPPFEIVTGPLAIAAAKVVAKESETGVFEGLSSAVPDPKSFPTSQYFSLPPGENSNELSTCPLKLSPTVSPFEMWENSSAQMSGDHSLRDSRQNMGTVASKGRKTLLRGIYPES